MYNIHKMKTYTGNIRLYFSSHQSAPRVWCILAGDHEFEVEAISVAGVFLETKYDPRWRGSEFHPCAWLECDAQLQILEDGTALIIQR
jgi:hypothetical protein